MRFPSSRDSWLALPGTFIERIENWYSSENKILWATDLLCIIEVAREVEMELIHVFGLKEIEGKKWKSTEEEVEGPMGWDIMLGSPWRGLKDQFV